MICCICNREREAFKVIIVTKEEKEAVKAAVGKDVESLSYCRPCWGIMEDKVLGSQLFKGLLQLQLQSRGVANAEELTSRIQAQMVKKAKVTS